MAKTEEGVRDRVVLEYPTDLFKTLVCRKCLPAKEDMEELSLGLSSNGRFGVDPKDAKLARSSSIPGFNGGNGDEEAVVPNGFSYASSLVRARSLPREAAEEWRKRKEMQSLRMMETKRKRSEKQGSLKGVADQTGDNGGGRRIGESLNGFSGIGIWRLECNSAGAGERFVWNRSDKVPPLPHPSKASVDSQGSGSDSGNNLYGEAQSHADNQPSPESDEKQPAGPEMEVEIAGVGRVSQTKAKELMRKVFVDMPCVSTMGEGPNGERVEGFLYKYRKVEEVRIVCVCHGQFFSPAEFVRHAGGREVVNPLRHIIVSPCFS